MVFGCDLCKFVDELLIPYCVLYPTRIHVQEAGNFLRNKPVFVISCEVEHLEFRGSLGPKLEFFSGGPPSMCLSTTLGRNLKFFNSLRTEIGPSLPTLLGSILGSRAGITSVSHQIFGKPCLWK